jgi:hypothetical protein
VAAAWRAATMVPTVCVAAAEWWDTSLSSILTCMLQYCCLVSPHGQPARQAPLYQCICWKCLDYICRAQPGQPCGAAGFTVIRVSDRLLAAAPCSNTIIIMLPNQAIASTPSAPRPSEALVENAGVKLVKHAKQGDTTVVGGVCQITLLGHVHNCAWYLVYLLELPHQVAVL